METKRIKHSKYKNTGLLFELLVRQTTSDVLNEKDDSIAIRLIKRYFNKDKPLAKELRLYKTLIETKYAAGDKAKDLIDEILRARNRLSNTILRKEKYNLIKEIKENYNIDEFFKNKLNNYKELASIYKLFEEQSGEGELEPAEAVQCKHTLIERIVDKPITKPETEINESEFDEYKKQSEDLKKLAYKMIIEKFNEKYQSLDVRQKDLLREFIYNSTDVSSFRSFVNEQIDDVKNELVTNSAKIKDDGTRIKVEGVLSHLDTLKNNKGMIKDNHLIQLMRYFELAKEIKKSTPKEKIDG